ncbi:hypothetical protein [Flavobacterium hungaricum]|uniref:Uncharacterized protein n=1 Tax=Flavobacterium hungaricum TaxID=2082725 RepID=A0ABR9THA0_9FLAO|nr:hypothetical protein [Flavobacterium hungaricum]MBE8724042.1 hypothetical protein [Flavobacterium hungaricum]
MMPKQLLSFVFILIFIAFKNDTKENKETTTAAIAEKNLAFQPITLQAIKSEIEKPNRFN